MAKRIAKGMVALTLDEYLELMGELPDEESDEEYEEMENNKVTISRKEFMNMCDSLVIPEIDNLDFSDILLLGTFVSALRTLIFDTDKKTDKEEK